MEGAKNSYNKTDVADRLAEIRLELAAKKAGNSSQKSYTPQSILPIPESLGLTDSVAAMQANFQFPVEGLGLTDLPVVTGYTGITFKSGSGTSVALTSQKLALLFEQGGVDISGLAHTVTVGSSITYKQGKQFFGAYFPQDANSVVTVTDAADLRVSAAFSFACWVLFTNLTADGAVSLVICNKQDDANNAYNFRVDSTGILSIAVMRAGVTTAFNSAAATIVAGSLTHVGFTYNAGTLTVYVNGAAVSDAGGGAIGVLPTAPDLIIGRKTNATGRFIGTMDDVMLWQKVLSAAEMLNLYTYQENRFNFSSFTTSAGAYP